MLHQREARKLGITMAVLVLTAFVGSAARASIIDTLDTTANFDGGFGGTTATANGDGTVTLTRNTTGIDAGIDWMIGGTANIPLGVDTNELDLIPVGTDNGGYYSVSLLFFDNTNSFLGESYWILNSNSTSPQTLPSVSAFAAASFISGEASYFVRFRIQPIDQAPASFTFTEIDAVPEPCTLVLLCPAVLFMMPGGARLAGRHFERMSRMPISRHEPHHPTARAFTLVELLVVITVIILLISLLLPVLASTRKAGQTAVCGSNLHQIMIAFVAYADENGGYLPYQTLPSFADWSGTLAGYMQSPYAFRCPEDPNTRLAAVNDQPWRSYAINSGKFTYLGNGYHSPWPPTSTDLPEKFFDVPNQVLLVGQNDGHDGINGPDAPDGAWDGITGVSAAVVGVAAFEGLDAYAWDLHPAKGINYGFSDGSIRFLTRAYIDQWRADTDYGGDRGDPWKWRK